MTFFACLRRVVVALILLAGCHFATAAETPATPPPDSTAQAQVTAASDSLFDYDRSAPLDVEEVDSETRDDAVIRDVVFAGHKSRIKAYLVSPAHGGESLAAILYVHWLGERTTTNRTEFLNEAVALASQGVVSLLIDAMWAEPKWYEKRIPEEDYDRSIAQVIDLRRSLDLLLSQTGVDPNRVAFVGHDFGAMYGIIMGAVDRRPSTYVLMAGTPHLIDWFLFARQPKSLEDYRRQLAPLDPINFVPKLAPTPVFFQFAGNDEYVPPEAAQKFYGAALPRKQTAMYDSGHDLQKPEVTVDRINWLMRMLKLQR
jgi:cephalosporin-C deacetylase-like acetyl esterase